ncbi:large ribosomal subunit protein mL63 [Cherax quadricarinatus]|uniref:large ribosomal subunit protein mL63 n=1 Tax=Cherax quadricarinatus TaxID=27406 RepID=UPI002378D3A1|nr:ribosomal protein 63, mitochondrial-like isoform X2 [Cherax quadricarinatus]
MRLSVLLFRKKMPNGNIWIGKHRMIPKVTELETGNASKRLQLEEQNMFYLRHPYLTLDQSWGHATALGKHKAFIRRMYLKQQKFQPNVTLEERYNILRNTDHWD